MTASSLAHLLVPVQSIPLKTHGQQLPDGHHDRLTVQIVLAVHVNR